MTYPLIIRRPAAVDTLEAAAWYENQRENWGTQFKTQVQSTVSRVIENPELYGQTHKDIRRAPVHQFPYGVYFRILEETVVVIAVLHGKRSSRVLKSRLD